MKWKDGREKSHFDSRRKPAALQEGSMNLTIPSYRQCQPMSIRRMTREESWQSVNTVSGETDLFIRQPFVNMMKTGIKRTRERARRRFSGISPA